MESKLGRAYFSTEAKISVFIQVEPKGEPPLSMFAGTLWREQRGLTWKVVSISL